MTRRGWLLFAAMCVIWGIPYLLIRVAVRDLSPGTLVFARTAIGAALLLPVAARRGHLRPLLPYWRVMLVYSAVEIAGPWLLLSHAEQRLSSSLAGLLIAAVPLIGAVLARATGSDDRIDPGRLVGLFVGLAGVVALLGIEVGSVDMVAVGEVGLTAVGYAAGPIIITRGLAGLPSLGVVSASLGVTAVGYLPVAVLQWPHAVSAESAVSVVVLAVVCTALAFLVFFALIAEVGPARSTVITYVNPAVAIALGVALLGEEVTVGMAVGFPLVLVGSVLATRRRPATPPPTEALDVRADTAAVPIAES